MAQTLDQIERIGAKVLLKNQFNELKTDGFFEPNSPQTDKYNCIAFAMGLEDWWVDPYPNVPGHWWPPTVVQDMDPSILIQAFEYLGFEKCENGVPEIGFEKVALYRKYVDSFKRIVWTHAAKIVGLDKYHSKLGPSYDVFHSSSSTFGYGEIFQFMRRSTSLPLTSQRKDTADDGDIEIDDSISISF